MFLLSADEDTLTGMRLVGIDGVLVNDKESFVEKSIVISQRSDVGILLVTKTLADAYPEQVTQLKKNSRLLVTQIPDMKNPVLEGNSITKYVRDTVGIKL